MHDKQTAAYRSRCGLVGSEMCISDSTRVTMRAGRPAEQVEVDRVANSDNRATQRTGRPADQIVADRVAINETRATQRAGRPADQVEADRIGNSDNTDA